MQDSYRVQPGYEERANVASGCHGMHNESHVQQAVIQYFAEYDKHRKLTKVEACRQVRLTKEEYMM
jgi:hypothetical protein